MYSLEEYGNMIYDATRFRAYARATELAVRPGDIVVDLGCGPGAFAMLACRAGARRVYALESGEILDMVLEHDGYADWRPEANELCAVVFLGS